MEPRGLPCEGDPNEGGLKSKNCAFLHNRDHLKMQFKWEFILQKKHYWSPWGDPGRGDLNKRVSKSKNCAFLHNRDLPPLKFKISVGSFYKEIDWSPWGDPVRANPNKKDQRVTKIGTFLFFDLQRWLDCYFNHIE